jgi:two-component system response regulator PrrA
MKRILLVDDDVASCEMAIRILKELDCAVDTVPDGSTALKHLRRAAPDAVLVSVNIPEMAGSAFVAACHQVSDCSGLPVVVMAVTPLAAVDAIRLGARGCIKKPLDMGGVMAGLQPLLQDRETRLRPGGPIAIKIAAITRA